MSILPLRRIFTAALAVAVVQSVALPVQAGPITFRAGATVRRIGAKFELDGRSPAINMQRGVGRSTDQAQGTTGGLFTGGSGTVTYDDGSVGPSFYTVAGNRDDGSAYTTIQDRSQVYDTGRIDEFGDPILAVDFHGSEYAFSRKKAVVSSDSVGVGPYMQAAISLVDRDGTLLNAVIGWSLVKTNHNSGMHRIITVNETRATYTYDTVLLEPLPSFPYTDPANSSGLGAIIIDSNNDVVSPLGVDPKRTADKRSRLVYALASANLDVTLNEIPIGIEYGRRIGKAQVMFTAGATLNVISHDLRSQITWYRSDGSTLTDRWQDDGDDVRVGLYGGLMVRYPLCESGKVYLEAHGTYRWVDTVSAQAGFAKTEIDVSSFEAGLGLGVEL